MSSFSGSAKRAIRFRALTLDRVFIKFIASDNYTIAFYSIIKIEGFSLVYISLSNLTFFSGSTSNNSTTLYFN